MPFPWCHARFPFLATRVPGRRTAPGPFGCSQINNSYPLFCKTIGFGTISGKASGGVAAADLRRAQPGGRVGGRPAARDGQSAAAADAERRQRARQGPGAQLNAD